MVDHGQTSPDMVTQWSKHGPSMVQTDRKTVRIWSITVVLARRLFSVSMSVLHKGPSEALRLSVSRQLSAGCDSLRSPWMWSWFRFNGAGMGREQSGGGQGCVVVNTWSIRVALVRRLFSVSMSGFAQGSVGSVAPECLLCRQRRAGGSVGSVAPECLSRRSVCLFR